MPPCVKSASRDKPPPDILPARENCEEAVSIMLLNEFLKEHRRNEQQEATIARQQGIPRRADTRICGLSATLGLSEVASGEMTAHRTLHSGSAGLIPAYPNYRNQT